MADAFDDYETAADGFAAVLADAEQRLDAETPCVGWKVRDVVDHVLDACSSFTQAFGGEAPTYPDGASPSERFAIGRRAVAESAARPGALDGMVPSPAGGEMPKAVMFGIAASDTLLHTWDLGRAIGRDVELDEGVLRATYERMAPVDEAIRRPGFFGPKVDVADDAPFQDRALAFFGRTP